jgi:hypothetical protein
VNCRANKKNKNNFESHTQRGYPRRPSETQRRSYNMFESLSTEVECYKCKKFRHMEKDCRMTFPPREQQQNRNSHRQEPQKNSIAMKNAHSLYKISRRNMVGMLTVGVQNIWQVIETCFLHYKRKDMDQSPSEMMIQPKSLEKAQSELGTRIQR